MRFGVSADSRRLIVYRLLQVVQPLKPCGGPWILSKKMPGDHRGPSGIMLTEPRLICCADSVPGSVGVPHPGDFRRVDFDDRAAGRLADVAGGHADVDRRDADPVSAAAG